MRGIKTMDNLINEIISKISLNRISTTEVADCLGKTGALKNVKAFNRGHHRVGRVFWSYAYNNSNWELHQQLRKIPFDSIVVVDLYNVNDRAVFGHLVSKYLTLYCRAQAIVVNGLIRDAHKIIKDDFPIWCTGTTPIGCFNTPNDEPLPKIVYEEFKKKYEGSIAVCDDSGCVIITPANLNKDFLDKLDFIELQEDIWYFCIDTKKWDTFETVAMKRYLDEKDSLPVEYYEQMKKYDIINKEK